MMHTVVLHAHRYEDKIIRRSIRVPSMKGEGNIATLKGGILPPPHGGVAIPAAMRWRMVEPAKYA